jgi:hypothetical protein
MSAASGRLPLIDPCAECFPELHFTPGLKRSPAQMRAATQRTGNFEANAIMNKKFDKKVEVQIQISLWIGPEKRSRNRYYLHRPV